LAQILEKSEKQKFKASIGVQSWATSQRSKLC